MNSWSNKILQQNSLIAIRSISGHPYWKGMTSDYKAVLSWKVHKLKTACSFLKFTTLPASEMKFLLLHNNSFHYLNTFGVFFFSPLKFLRSCNTSIFLIVAGSTSANRKLSHGQPACRTGMIKDRPPTLPPKARESRGGHSLTLAIALAWAHTEWLQLATSAMAATCSRHSWNTLFLTVCYQRNLIHCL